MIIKKIGVFIFFLGLISCQFFTDTSDSSQQELDSIDFTTIDSPPVFTECESFSSKKAKDSCFRSTLHQLLVADLASVSLESSSVLKEFVDVVIRISNQGKISLRNIDSSPEIKKEFPNLDSIIQQSIATYPRVFPAIKRDIKVATEYIIPLLINTEN